MALRKIRLRGTIRSGEDDPLIQQIGTSKPNLEKNELMT